MQCLVISLNFTKIISSARGKVFCLYRGMIMGNQSLQKLMKNEKKKKEKKKQGNDEI